MSSFLYPMLGEGTGDATTLLAVLAGSAEAKAVESAQNRAHHLARLAPELERAADAMAQAFLAGGRLFCFGNGGSATDAAGLSDLFASPATGRRVGARSLVADSAVLTALANDVGFDVVFARQLLAHGRAGDIALGLSTSGGSVNVLQGFAAGRRAGMLTVGLAGYGGGAMRTCADIDHCLAVDGQSVHRVQETQSALAHELWRRVRHRLDAGAGA